MSYIYLDNAATTPIDSRVKDAMLPYLQEQFGNASSVHKFGRAAKVLLEDARDAVAEFTGARSSEIYFTSGGTEANNFALKGIAFRHLGGKNHIISSKIEHSAIIDTLEYLRERFGFEITYINNDKHGIIDIDELKDSIKDNTLLVTIMHANNELGVINDIAAVSKLCKKKNVFFHSDCVQSIGKTVYTLSELSTDTASLSAHKIYGPKGIGALFIRKDTPIDKLMHGGKQERDRRGGTENIAGIAGFKKAVEILKEEMDRDIGIYSSLRNRLTNELVNRFHDKVIINSMLQEGASVPNILNISFSPEAKIDHDTMLIKLDLKGIAVSSGSACSSGSIQPSHVLKAIGYDDRTAKSSLRISFGRFNNEKDVDSLVKALKEIINEAI